MSSSLVPLYYICSLAGFFMIVGGIWLIYKEKIFIDKETGQVTKVEVPGIGLKFQTNVPALVLFALGFIPLIYPIWVQSQALELVEVQGKVETDAKTANLSRVYFSIANYSLGNSGEFKLKVPLLGKQEGEPEIVYVLSTPKGYAYTTASLVNLKKHANGVLDLGTTLKYQPDGMALELAPPSDIPPASADYIPGN